LIGVATTKDVKIISIKPLQSSQEQLVNLSNAQMTQQSLTLTSPKYETHVITHFEEHGAQVWRVSWNITGTILASSGDDGTVRLWKANYLENWKNVGVLKADPSSANGMVNGESFPNEVQETTFNNLHSRFKQLTTITQPSAWN